MLRKYLAISTVFLGSLFVGAAFVSAGDEAPARTKAGEGNSRREEMMLKRFDKNGDGKLDDAERQEAKKARGARRGGTSAAAGGRVDPDKMKELMKKYDKDGDGKLSDTEKQAAKGEFEKLRETGKRPAGAADGRRAEAMKRFDKNGDGKLDDNEKSAAKEAMQKRRPNRQRPAESK